MSLSLKDFSHLNKTKQQGSGRTVVYTASWKGQDVVLKVQKKEHDRLEHSFELLLLQLPGMVKIIHKDVMDDGYPCMILERLTPLPDSLSIEQVKQVASITLFLIRTLYRKGYYWTMRLSHIMLNKDGMIKLIDFNDDDYKHIPFFSTNEEAVIMKGECSNDGIYHYHRVHPYSSWMATIYYLCKCNGYNADAIVQEAIDSLFVKEYQNAINVHQPIYFPPYQDVLRTETEKNDKDYGKLVKPNRMCTDRALIMSRVIEQHMPLTTYLDIGCNVGWFPFYFHDKLGLKCHGVDANVGQIEFATMLSEYKTNGAVTFSSADVTPKYLQECSHYDIVSALSILHWLVTLPPAGSAQIASEHDVVYFKDIIRDIGRITDRLFFVELPEWVLPKLHIRNLADLCTMIKDVGGFKRHEILDKSDAKRNILVFVK